MKGHFAFFICFALFAEAVFGLSVTEHKLVPRQTGQYLRGAQGALNTKTGETLVIWERRNWQQQQNVTNSIHGQLLQADGTPKGSTFEIIPALENPLLPTLIYDPDANQFVLTYSRVTQGVSRPVTEVYVVRLKPTGRKKRKAVRVSEQPSFEHILNTSSFITYDAQTKGYVIVWSRIENSGASDPNQPRGIYGKVLNSNLTTRQNPVKIAELFLTGGFLLGPYVQEISVHQPSRKLFIAQYFLFGEPGTSLRAEPQIAQADATLKTPGSKLTVLKTAPITNGGGVDLVDLSSGGLMALYGDDDGAKRKKISTIGTISSSSGKFFLGSIRSKPVETGDALSVGNTTQLAVVASEDSETEAGKIWFQVANSKGKAVGAPVRILSGVDLWHPATISALPPVPGGHAFAVLHIEGERDSPPSTTDTRGSGLNLLIVNTAP